MARWQFYGLIAAIFMVAQEIHHEVMPLIAAILFAIFSGICYLLEEVENNE